MIKVSYREPTTVGFKVEIQGASSTPLIRFVLKKDEKISFLFVANVYDDKVMVNFPPIGNIFDVQPEEAELYGHLEVIVDGSYFIPWEGKLTVSSPIAVKAAVKEIENDISMNKNEEIDFNVSANLIEEKKEYKELSEKKKSDFMKFLKTKGLI